MFKIKSNIKNIISLFLIITIIEYTVFSVRISAFYSLIVTVLMSLTFYFVESKKLLRIGIAYSLIISFISFYISFDITIIDNMFYYIFNYIKIHLFAVVVNVCFKKELDFKNALCTIFFVSLFLSVFELAKFKFIDNISYTNNLSENLDEYINTYISTAKMSGFNFDSEQHAAILYKAKELLLIMLPSFFMIVSFIESFILYFISRNFISAFCRKTIRDDSKFRCFYLGKGLSFIVLILLIISKKGSMFENCVYNFAIIASFLYFAAGFSVVGYFINKLIKNNILLYICMLIVVVFSFFTMLILPTINGISIIFLIGITDTTFDFRKIRPKKLIK